MSYELLLGPGDEHRCELVESLGQGRVLVRFASNGAELRVPGELLRPARARRPSRSSAGSSLSAEPVEEPPPQSNLPL